MAILKSAATAVDVAGMKRPAGQLDTATALQLYSGPWNERLAAHLLRRAGFGGSPDDVRRYTRMSMHDAVESFIRFPSTANLPGPPALFDTYSYRRQVMQQTFGGGTMGGMFGGLGGGGGRGAGRPQLSDDQKREIFKTIRQQERQSVMGLQLWWLNRMLQTPAPLQEKMALYFHGHFTTATIQKGVTPLMTYNQNQLFRNYALGNLRELTRNVSKDPAMLIYLDNGTNVASHPNENYARELMELFTLGVDHYSEEDVRQSARAWTGWMLDRRTGQATFATNRHDKGMKTFLGQTGNFDGDDIVNIIFNKPQCASFFATNLLNFFVYNNPEPDLVDAVAGLIQQHDYNLAPVMSKLLHSNLFYSDRAYRALVKSPVEFVVGTYKALGLAEMDQIAQRALVAMGQVLFYPPNVAGWPGGENWMTSQMLIARQNFVASLVNSQTMRPGTAMQQGSGDWLTSLPMNAQQATRNLIATILQGDASSASYSQLVGYLNGANTSALGQLSPENYDERVRGAAYLTMAMPAYQLN